MGAIVGGIILFVIGAICRFALEVDLPFVAGGTLGTILMVGGGVLFLVGLLLMLAGRRTTVTARQDPSGYVAERRDPGAGL
ncbi:hypothetical protein Bequi_00215 [Brachybacterium sp. JHP9]|uniref:Uncharacterized protein n=1 Tax=Brachybacterium equifaecis TaxID=2910770 RepID=A0ABT0QXT6_9MICO|nr:hypothetical protein [Brachybacterium equifaecis]MCL6421819.1 hypothetical protein [Brachybacterium equifaecis]